MVRVDILDLFMNLGAKHQSFTIIYNNRCRFFIDTLYQVKELLLYFCFPKSFYHEWVLNFVNFLKTAAIYMTM